jgi:hypothetical protein
MRWSDLPLAPTPRTLRQFAALWLVLLAGLAGWQGLVRQRPVLGVVLGVLAVAVGLLGLIRPPSIRPVFVALTVVSFPLGWVLTRVALATVFFGLFTPLALVFRLAGRDALVLRRPRDRASYWEPKPAPAGVRSYFQQF